MAQRIKLDLDASDNLDFKREVTLPTPDGKGLKVEFTFKYRDREAVGELFAAYADQSGADMLARSEARAKAIAAAEQAGQDTTAARAEINRKAVAEVIDDDVATVMEMATGWNIEASFNADNVRKLCTKYAGAAVAIVADYRVSLTQGRLGN